jgi:DNA polymerase-3 subunit epsilon
VGIEAQLIRFGEYFSRAKIDLDANWRSINYCAIDIETTGLDLRKDEIISIGAAQIHEERIKTGNNFYQEVRPRQMPSVKSIEIHGLRTIDLVKADPIEVIIPEFKAQINNRVLIAHAAWIEFAFLKPYLQGVDLSSLRRMIDTAALARACGYAADLNEREPSLESLCRRLHLPVYAPHNALGDALTTAVVFLALATELERETLAKGASELSLRVLLKTSSMKARR